MTFFDVIKSQLQKEQTCLYNHKQEVDCIYLVSLTGVVLRGSAFKKNQG